MHHATLRTVARVLGTALVLGAPVAAADLLVAGGSDAGGLRGRVSLQSLRVADDVFAVGVGHLGGRAAAALQWRRTLTAGPVGNLVIEGGLGTDGDGMAAALGARGVAGPVALALRVDAGTRAPGPWPVLAEVPALAPVADPRRLTGGAPGDVLVFAQLGATWRVDRAWTLSARPHAAWTPTGWVGGFEVGARRGAVANDVDVDASVAWAVGPTAARGAAGLSVHHVPRRAPESSAAVWFGADEGAWGPGFEVRASSREGAAEATVTAAWGFLPTGRTGGFVTADVQAPTRLGRWRLAGGWRAGDGALFELGWSRPLAR